AGTPFHFGAKQTSFDQHANMADRSIEGFVQDTRQRSFLMEIYPDWMLRVKGVDDGHMVTAPVGSYYSNAWGLHDVHGNAAEWTLSDYDAGRKVVRGGSWNDRPHRCRADSRYGYPAWQRVYNVGFRVAMEAGE
ncbi:MAG: SUMF1/EgtB/PvdO family nonheme iron enzyme, partial [bacterium]|nr:SUMF1/EgtB/PvdO family nonheme iron enzyme [bacterium]